MKPNMINPLVSVFLPTHSRFKNGLLSRSLESILSQTYTYFELFVVDDASTDGACDYIKRVAEADQRVRHIRFDKNVGLPAKTLASAFLGSKGELLAFAFDDTEWLPNHLELLVRALQNNPQAGMAYSEVIIEVPGGEIFTLGAKDLDIEQLTRFNYVGNCGVVLTRETVNKVGWYDPHILVKRCCDWDLWLRIARKGISAVRTGRVTAREHGALQNDSIGASVTLYDNLTRKYLATERDDVLAPNLIVQDESSMFKPLRWMNEEEIHQLKILCFEHHLRVCDIDSVIALSNQLVTAPFDSNAKTLVEGFKLFLAETRYSCKGTCESAYKLSSVLSALNATTACYRQIEGYHARLNNEFDEIVEKYCKADTLLHSILASRSWRLTTVLRKLKRFCRSHRYTYKIAKAITAPLRSTKIG